MKRNILFSLLLSLAIFSWGFDVAYAETEVADEATNEVEKEEVVEEVIKDEKDKELSDTTDEAEGNVDEKKENKNEEKDQIHIETKQLHIQSKQIRTNVTSTNKTQNTNKLPYKNGDKHAGVVELKLMLKKVGIGNYPDNPSKNFGSSTTRNVKKFQSYFPELRQDGVVDTKTWNKLNSIVNSKYQKGKKGSHVVELKLMLKDLGIGNYPAKPSGNYGSSTERNVRTFQQQNNLLPSGIADESTIAKMKRILSLPYKQGDRHNNIVKLKKMLTFAGIGNYPSNPSNYFGSSTTKNVKKFQSYYKDLRKDGVVDEATWKKLIDIHTSPYVQGAKGNHVVELKKKLSKIGFGNYPKNPSTNFGKSTANNVKKFQSYYGLIENGIADEVTLKKIDEILKSPYQRGKSGNHVVQLKKKLKRLGIGNYPANPSGSYGKSTENNVRKFQSYYGLIENGIADEVTLKKIDEILKSPYQRGKSGNHVVQLKKDLSKLGIGNYPAKPSPNYGSSTERNVKTFQETYGLLVNGIADEVTLKKLKNLVKNATNNKINSTSSSKVRIVIDAGHGGSDPGAIANKLKEKDLTLYIAKEIEKELKKYKNVDVKMIRTKDEFLSLQERSKLANGWKADFYLSVHINAGGGTGIESYVYNKATKDELKKQAIIHDHLVAGLRKDNVRDRGKKKANFHVLRETNMSALLVEYLFIDNVTDANKLKNNSFKKKMARLTAEGIAKSFNLKKK